MIPSLPSKSCDARVIRNYGAHPGARATHIGDHPHWSQSAPRQPVKYGYVFSFSCFTVHLLLLTSKTLFRILHRVGRRSNDVYLSSWKKVKELMESGDMNGISHISRIASGGYGEVHKVILMKYDWLTVDVRRSDATGKYCNIFSSLVDLQIFARKILRLFGGVRKEDIDNEARAVSQLCAPGRCKNVVEVIRHGWLPTDSSYYYIDMEYCSETLDDRIHGRSREAERDSESPYADPKSALEAPRST